MYRGRREGVGGNALGRESTARMNNVSLCLRITCSPPERRPPRPRPNPTSSDFSSTTPTSCTVRLTAWARRRW